jgi:hypothetical protein
LNYLRNVYRCTGVLILYRCEGVSCKYLILGWLTGFTAVQARIRKKAGLAGFAELAELAAMVRFMLLMASFQWTVDR